MRERGRLRIGESLGEATALRKEVEAWRSCWDAVDTIGGHLSHVDLLCTVIFGLIDEITRRTEAIEPTIGAGTVYEECRRQDLRLLHTRRLWRWYADKLDQRTGPENSNEVRTLLAADEVIWSCWKAAFMTMGDPVPPAPIPYLAPVYSSTATPRADPPAGLRPGDDDLLRKHIEQLPVAAVPLPPVCCRRPWWIVLCAHEASHHIQFETQGLEELTQQRVVASAYSCAGDTELAEAWLPWSRELFADACSVLLVGSAAVWAVAELETRTDAGLRKSPSGGYPPPIIRLAVLREVADQTGIPVRDEMLAGFISPAKEEEDDDRIRRLLACVPDVAAALTEIVPGQWARTLAKMTSGAYADGGTVSAWRSELLGAHEPLPRQGLDAARFCIAAAVDAWERFGHEDGLAERLAPRLRSILPRCREPGKRAAEVTVDAASVTRQLVADLYIDHTARSI